MWWASSVQHPHLLCLFQIHCLKVGAYCHHYYSNHCPLSLAPSSLSQFNDLNLNLCWHSHYRCRRQWCLLCWHQVCAKSVTVENYFARFLESNWTPLTMLLKKLSRILDWAGCFRAEWINHHVCGFVLKITQASHSAKFLRSPNLSLCSRWSSSNYCDYFCYCSCSAHLFCLESLSKTCVVACFVWMRVCRGICCDLPSKLFWPPIIIIAKTEES